MPCGEHVSEPCPCWTRGAGEILTSTRRRRHVPVTSCLPHKTILCTFLCGMILVQIASAQEESYLRGENATLTCDVISGKSAASTAYTWFKHTEAGGQTFVATSVAGVSTISENGPLAGRASFDPPFLYIRDLEVTDSAKYSCQAIGTGVQTSSTVLKVNAVPIVTVEVVSSPIVDKLNGQYEAAVCKAVGGSPPGRITWVRSSTGEIQESNETTEVLSDGTFTVKSRLRLHPGLLGREPNTTEPVTDDDARKNFGCRVSHDYFRSDEDELKTVLISLLYSPIVTISVESNKLTCAAFGNPAPVVTWTRPDGRKEVGTPSIYVDQTTPSASSGRYVCVAKSSIGPEAVAAIHVKNSRDLPTLFTNTLRYNASLPVKARGYEMECTAEVESLTDVAVQRIAFEWTKDGVPIDDLSPYQVVKNVEPISSEKSLVTSVLRMIDVRRHRDEGLFKCRLFLPATTTGYVRAVERSIQVTVDYPPESGTIQTTVHPRNRVREFTDVKLTCSATSSPKSSYEWFFNGRLKFSGPILMLNNVSRNEAGAYKCVAFNYVPGSAAEEITLTVEYSPGKVTIHRVSENYLECSTEGSVPPPIYTWLLPNGTATYGNLSLLHVPTFDVSAKTSYICMVSNGLPKTSNSTYVIRPVTTGKVGSLSVGEFIVTVIVCLLLLVLITVVAVWLIKRRDWGGSGGTVSKTKKDTKSSTLLHYTEPPYGGSLGSMPPMSFNRPPSDDFADNALKWNGSKNYDASKDMPNGKSAVMSPRAEGKPSLVNFGTLNSKSNLDEGSQNGLDAAGGRKYRSVDQLDGSGVEILDNSSMKSSILSRETGTRSMDLRNGVQRSPAKLTTFSNPARATEQPNAVNHYGTARMPAKGGMEATRPMTRALSEGFRPMLYDDTVRREKRDDDDSTIPTVFTTNTPTVISSTSDLAPPTYSALNARNMIPSPRPAASSPLPLPSLLPSNRVHSDEHESDSSDDLSSTPSTTRLASDGRVSSRALPMTEVAVTKPPMHPGYRYNAVSHDPYGTYHPDQPYRPSPVPSPLIQGINAGYDGEFTPPMQEIPNRNYLYQPYEARLGIPLSVQPAGRNGGSTATSPYDSGSDSAKSSGTTTAAGRRLQSLTLV